MVMCKNGIDVVNVIFFEYNLNSLILFYVVFELFFLLYFIEIEMKELMLNICFLRLLMWIL